MTIALFHNLPEGGAKIALYEQVKRLAKHHTLHLYSFISEAGEYDIRSYSNKIFLFPYQMINDEVHGLSRFHHDLKSYLLMRKVYKEIARQIDMGGYDLAFVHPDRLTQAPYLLRYLRTPSVYYCQEPLRIAYEYGLRLRKKVNPVKSWYEHLNRLIRKSIDRTNTRAATHVLCASEYVKDFISQAYDIKAEISPLGVDTALFKPLPGIKKEGVLFIGKRSSEDGYDLTCQALIRIPAKLKERLTVLEPAGRNKLKKSRQDVVLAYNQAKVTVCTASLEPFGFVPLESMACATPVVAVNEGGYRDTVLDGKTGFLVERDPETLSRKLTMIFEDESLRRKMGNAARIHVEKNWAWEKQIKKLEQSLLRISLHDS